MLHHSDEELGNAVPEGEEIRAGLTEELTEDESLTTDLVDLKQKQDGMLAEVVKIVTKERE